MITTTPPQTIIFIDYENWYLGLNNQSRNPEQKPNKKPNIQQLLDEIRQTSTIKEIYFFADFTQEYLSQERSRIQSYSSDIIDCANAEGNKDFTDFIIVDKIYRTVYERPDITRYILVSSDGHFQQVIAWARNYMQKEFGVYGTDISYRLKSSATWSKEIVREPLDTIKFEKMLFQVLHDAEKKENFISSFQRTITYCATVNHTDKEEIRFVLQKLISDEYIIQEERKTIDSNGNESVIRALQPNWTRIEKEKNFNVD